MRQLNRFTRTAALVGILALGKASGAYVGWGRLEAEGVALTGGAHWQEGLGLTGAGVRIAVVEQGFLEFPLAVALKEIPQPVACLVRIGGSENCADVNSVNNHGTSVAEIVKDMAPGAQLYFVKMGPDDDDSAGFNYILTSWLDLHQIDLVVLSMGYFKNAYFDGTHELDRYIDGQRQSRDRLFVVAAGNFRNGHVEQPQVTSATSFQLKVPEAPADTNIAVHVHLNWNQHWCTGNFQRYDLEIRRNGTRIWPQVPQSPPVCGEPERDAYITYNRGTDEDPNNYTVMVDRVGTSGAPADVTVFCLASPGFCLLTDDGINPRNPSSSLPNGATATGSIAVTGIPSYWWMTSWWTNTEMSEGPRKVNPLTKPDITAPASATTSREIFAGTSAAAPLIGGAAAMVLQGLRASGPVSEPDDSMEFYLLFALTDDFGAPGDDDVWGFGKLTLEETPPFGWTVTDTDGDSIADQADLCPSVSDPEQTDTDLDRVGNRCDHECPSGQTVSIAGIIPMSGRVGSTISIEGTGFGADAIVIFDLGGPEETVAEILSPPTATSISARVPSISLGNHVVRVINVNQGCESEDAPFTVTQGGGGGCGLGGVELVPLLLILAGTGSRTANRRRSA